ncbi:MAG: threonine-phosphate decarboxylase CobD [Methanothrix sp.]|uniref:threonine-phosphate decarboxylase CobD n=1 Tax=Methanothrix sp. TaxID=90426 RepID=UPI0025E69256|nr:threonine-phosphate decarboxylase CobD [Methanothrix sp.]MCQ8902716.1 threonine-phosphate decarboxylase CobD [Methanothrix sp.]
MRVRRSFAAVEPCEHGGRILELSRRLGAQILDFSASINPLGPPPLEDLVLSELKNISHYPDIKYSDFREAAASFVGVDPENIVPGNGSSEIIRIFSEVCLEDDEIALIPAPTFGEYETQSRLAGARIVKTDLGVEAPRALDSVFDEPLLRDAKAAFFCNPNNPTGKLTEREELIRLAERCESRGVFLLLDEAFIELSDPDQSLADLAPDMESLVVMRSLTKSFGVPGLRLGFAVTNRWLADIMNRARIPWSISSIASAVAVHLLKDEEFLERSRESIIKELEWLTGALRSIGLRPLRSSTNFILVDVKDTGLGSGELADRMLNEGILIRDCRSFGLDGYVRVAVRRRDENERLILAFKNVLEAR